jgi:hypothetical protein
MCDPRSAASVYYDLFSTVDAATPRADVLSLLNNSRPIYLESQRTYIDLTQYVNPDMIIGGAGGGELQFPVRRREILYSSRPNPFLCFT